MFRRVFICWSLAVFAYLLCVKSDANSDSPQIPYIAKLANDCWDFDSTLWHKALVIKNFKVPGANSGLVYGVVEATKPKQQTEVKIAHDKKNLYVRFIAFDDSVKDVKCRKLDEFADDFPSGDHGEIWIRCLGKIVFAFDCNGNKYDAKNFDPNYFSGFRVKSRKNNKNWEVIAVIPMRKIFRDKSRKSLEISFVRHLDNGDGEFERSTSTGKNELVQTKMEIGE